MSAPPVVATVDRRVRELYKAALPIDAGVLHVAAVWESPGGEWVTLAIHPGSPTSATDRFALGLARARADAIVTSGKVLRDEPALEHGTGVPGLDAWRRERLGRARPPVSVVLTSGRDLDLAHPLIRAGTVIVTGAEAAEQLAGPAATAGVEVAARPEPSLRDTLAWLRSERGARTLCVELGATTARDLYDDPVGVDELLLSIFLEPGLSERDRAAPFVSPGRLAAVFDTPSETRVLEESGRWRFRRYTRGRLV